MHDGNWGDHNKTGLIAGIIVAVLIAAAFIGWGLWKTAEYEREANNQAREYAAYTDEQISKACLSLPPVYQKDCATEARHEQRANERNEYDLVAQRKSALWAYIMGAAAVIGMGLSVIGVFLVYTTFHETRLANEIAKAPQRAWVRILAVPRHVENSGLSNLYIRADFTAENVGQTAATDFDFARAILFKGQSEEGGAFEQRVREKVEEWRKEYSDMGSATLVPNDPQVSPIWKIYERDDVKWWKELQPGLTSCCPILLAAVFYRTVSEPKTVQLSWRTWMLCSINDDGIINSWIPLPQNEIRSDRLCVEPFHMTMMHAEYPADEYEKRSADA